MGGQVKKKVCTMSVYRFGLETKMGELWFERGKNGLLGRVIEEIEKYEGVSGVIFPYDTFERIEQILSRKRKDVFDGDFKYDGENFRGIPMRVL